MNYNGIIYRPPIEVYSYLLPLTEGCSYNKCRFCSLYRNVNFRLLTLEEISARLSNLGKNARGIERVYLVGADPLTLSVNLLEQTIATIKKFLPRVEVISMNATIKNIKSKSDRNLKRLKNLSVNDLYVGVECGLDDVLKFLNKGNNVSDIREQCMRLNWMGIRYSGLIKLGAAGAGRGAECALATAELLNEISPDKILVDVLTNFPDAKLFDDIKTGKFIPARAKEMLIEEKILLENLNLPESYFWANNGVALVGYLGESQADFLRKIQRVIDDW